ncbi:DUF1549 and DUF1553 domain-containing protein [Methylococcus sp. EFPC2]|uniref:DUF1549 and DUF1553 domain-containing protein n=1 Tax=Methylococcus sp. EFPC2 TaxID=2812648 RepID=UPI001967F7E4|nr:DUF1549 and DUF1553 domain-containing protein [Methylococcus sp. EFPC2]QSA96426.1 DUF1553 domain-containing protein [Methylococcus sp. EFPC2]
MLSIAAGVAVAAEEKPLTDAAAKAIADWQQTVGGSAKAAQAPAGGDAAKAAAAWQQQVGGEAKTAQAPVAEKPAAAPAAEPAKVAQAAPAAEKPAETADASKAAPAAAPAKLWSWVPVARPEVPTVKQQEWVKSPLDAFVLAKLEEKGLKPSPEADRASLIRRVTLDLWGIIPTPEEVQAFVNDQSPDAYEKVVDRLLSSPRYGERQARHWLDLARYADSAGFQGDQTRPNQWRYRDYVIKAFNEDKPYSRFIQEQIAGDEIAPNDQNALVATGFLAGYPDNNNSRDLVQRKYQITTDIVDTVSTAVLGSSFQCARCHNHKTDKFTQKDYYSLQSFFANTSFSERQEALVKGEVDLKYEADKAKYEAAVKELKEKQRAILAPVLEKAVKYQKERYLTDSRESLFKPKDQWNAHDRWINYRWASVTADDDFGAYLRETTENKDSPDYDASNKERWEEYKKVSDELKKLDKLKPKHSNWITTATELGHADAPPTYVFFGGNHERPLDEVQPAFPAGITDEKPVVTPTATSSGRRTALANWLTSSNNPLTARVFVNRAWGQLFGSGIVRTVSDFGKAGDKPTNQALLDFVADDFVKKGWSVKQLHRDIVLSSTYRQSSDYREEIAKADPANNLLGVFPRKRLEAEQIRDSLLAASGKLDTKIGGPSVYAPLPTGLEAGQLWSNAKEDQEPNRRSLYIFTRRSIPYPLLETFDMASAQQVHSKRDVTTTPLQALTLYNNDQVFQWSQALAARVINEAGKDETAQLERLYQILFARSPDEEEKATLLSFLDNHEKVILEKAADGKFAIAVPQGVKEGKIQNPIRAAAFVDLVHTVANSNDFVYRF